MYNDTNISQTLSFTVYILMLQLNLASSLYHISSENLDGAHVIETSTGHKLPVKCGSPWRDDPRRNSDNRLEILIKTP